MTATVPASLKAADINRFAVRAAQLEVLKPAIAYWCNYWILNQILSKNLHNVDAEALTYTTTLMDKVEQFKNANSNNDAVTDDVAAKVYVEQFGLDTFAKADKAVLTNSVTLQTADTFQAAATFLDLLAVFGPLDTDIAPKIKYAKFHAVRIIKAVRAGEDPNLSNPKQEPAPEPELPALDPNDAEVKALGGTTPEQNHATVVEVPDEADKLQARLAQTSTLNESLHPSRDPSQGRPPRPSFVEVPDEAHRIQSKLAHVSSVDESLHPSRVPSRPASATGGVSPLAPQDASSFYTSNQNDISPIDTTPERKSSIGGNYFPIVSGDSYKGDPEVPMLPTQPLDSPSDMPSVPTEHRISRTSSVLHSDFASHPSQPPPQPSAPATFPPVEPTIDRAFSVPMPPSQQPQFPPDMSIQAASYQQQPIIRPQPRQNQLTPQPQPQLPSYQQIKGPTTLPSTYHYQLTPQPQPQLPSYQQIKGPTTLPSTYHYQQPAPTSAVYGQPVGHPHAAAPVPQPVPQPPVQSDVVLDEEAMMKAQKHARWAISALNFEDVPTAIKELQGALAVLGAR